MLLCLHVSVVEMLEDSTDDGEFSNIALCVCSAADSISVSEDELAHIQVSIGTWANKRMVLLWC